MFRLLLQETRGGMSHRYKSAVLSFCLSYLTVSAMIDSLPMFSKLDLKNVASELKERIKTNLKAIEAIKKAPPSWQGVDALEALSVSLSHFWSPINHLNYVKSNQELRELVEACLPLIVDYHATLEQDEALYDYFKKVAETHLTKEQQSAVNKMIQDFELSGVHLPQEQKNRLKEIETELSQLSNRFSQNVMDSTDAFKHFVDESMLDGVPESSKHLFAEKAKKEGKKGFCVGIDYPSYDAIMRFSTPRELRKIIYEAYISKASELGAKERDNTPVIQQILALRSEMAKILGFSHYAAYSLANKMAKDPNRVISFLDKLCHLAKERAENEAEEIRSYARKNGQSELMPWDYAFWARHYKEAFFDVSEEEIRAYFPLSQVLLGLFEIMQSLYGLTVEQISRFDSYHEDVRCYQLSENGKVKGYVMMDLFARQNKRGGAWMDECRIHHKLHKSESLPVAYLVCNFESQEGEARLTHSDVVTLFHEMGHVLHHLLTEVEIPSISGINGVPWDAVELPSQFFENWAWEKEGLMRLTASPKDQERMPDELIEKLQKTRYFQEAVMLCRQLEFSLFDFQLHMTELKNFQDILNEVRKKIRVLPVSDKDRFAQGFNHIFAGGYAAGYYSYKWAEVLAYDAFSLFKEKGILNQEIGKRFRNTILASGGSQSPEALFQLFRGREPDESIMLKAQGILYP